MLSEKFGWNGPSDSGSGTSGTLFSHNRLDIQVL